MQGGECRAWAWYQYLFFYGGIGGSLFVTCWFLILFSCFFNNENKKRKGKKGKDNSSTKVGVSDEYYEDFDEDDRYEEILLD